MDSTRKRVGSSLLIGAGVLLVAAFLGWLVLRNHEALESALGMTSLLGWVTHGLALLILLGGVSLLARGLSRGSNKGSDVVD